jgi:hypothetical protein
MILYVTLRGKQMPEKMTEIRMGTGQRKEEDLGGKLRRRRSFRRSETGGETWPLDDVCIK